MFFKSNRSLHERGILFAILLGIVGYLISAGFIYTQITPEPTSFTSLKALQTKVLDSSYGNEGIRFKANYLSDLSKLNTEITHDGKEQEGTFYKKSRLFDDVIFSSRSEVDLHLAISGLDLKYAKKIGKQDIPNPYFMNRNPKIALWVLLISICVGFSLFLSPLFYAGIKSYNVDLNGKVRAGNIIFAIIVFILLVVPLFLPPIVYPGILFKPTDTTMYFDAGFSQSAIFYGATVPFIAPIFWLVLIFTINSKVSHLYKDNFDELLLKFNMIKQDTETYFIIMGLFLAFTIYCTDTLLATLNGLALERPTLFPREFAFSNGLIQTFFLVIIYAGIRINFNRIQRGIEENTNLTETVKEEMAEDKSFVSYLKVILAMLAPLIGSGLQDLIGMFG